MMSRSPADIWDLTLPLSDDSVIFPGDSPPKIQRISDLKKGDALTVSTLTMGCHVGTHLDAPAHFVLNGSGVEELPLEAFFGPAVVSSFLGQTVIEESFLKESNLPERHHLLFQTDNSQLLERDTFSQDYCFLSPEAAEYLCHLHPLSVGFDYYSVDRYSDSEQFPSHTIFAQADIPVFVCLNLLHIPEGSYTFAGFPLRIVGAEAAPVRAILIKEKG